MHRMRNKGGLVLLALLTLALAAATATADSGKTREYVVVYDQGATAAQGRDAVKAAGGTVVSDNAAIGVATVKSKRSDFVALADRQGALDGAAANEAIGKVPQERRAKWSDIEKVQGAQGKAPTAAKARKGAKGITPEPLAGLQWDMKMIGATAEGSYARQQGSKAVRVGVIDTGLDASHPDIAPNFDKSLSRNFTVDDPFIDGACDTDPDKSCQDPANVDEGGHGTHVGGTIAAALNGLGTAGVAPKVDLVNLRAGQDSGYFFIGPVTDALTYAGDHGIDVVNMSFYIDPFLYNCASNPSASDSIPEQNQQKIVVEATQRALKYARDRGVTLIAAEGNGHTDLGKPTSDTTSPDYPDQVRSPHPRTVDNSCLSMPTEGQDVIGVTSVAPSKRKAYYSDYGLEQADVSAPGGDTHDGGTAASNVANAVLAPYPLQLAQEEGAVDPAGNPTTPAVVKSCSRKACGYYEYLQGTSMASPHAVGVAALAIAQFGTPDGKGGVGLPPAQVEQLLTSTATDTPCPAQNPYVYPNQSPVYTATCEGTPQRNGFYGDGIVDAQRILIGH